MTATPTTTYDIEKDTGDWRGEFGRVPLALELRTAASAEADVYVLFQDGETPRLGEYERPPMMSASVEHDDFAMDCVSEGTRVEAARLLADAGYADAETMQAAVWWRVCNEWDDYED